MGPHALVTSVFTVNRQDGAPNPALDALELGRRPPFPPELASILPPEPIAALPVPNRCGRRLGHEPTHGCQ